MSYIQTLLDGIAKDELRDKSLLHLTANEPLVSRTATNFLTSRLLNRYYFGRGDQEGVVDFGPSTYLGLQGVADIVDAASTTVSDLLFGDSANLSCLSGLHAMTCAILSTTQPGDYVMSVSLDSGGHFSTTQIIKNLGRKNIYADFDLHTLKFIPEKIARKVEKYKVSTIYLDVSFYLNPINISEIREAVGDRVTIIYDASHTLGLMIGQRFQQPLLEGADIISANTHKTLPGPQKGILIMKTSRDSEKVNGLISNGYVSSPHTSEMIALAVTLLEMKEFGKEYATQIINNSQALGGELVKLGHEVRLANTGEVSENHQVHLFTDSAGDYRKLYWSFISNNISVNFSNALGGRMFIRLGTQEITRRGMNEVDMRVIAQFIHDSLMGNDVAKKVTQFNSKFNRVHFSYDKS